MTLPCEGDTGVRNLTGVTTEPDVNPADLRIDRDRLLDRLAALSDIGGIAGTTGSSRLAFSDDDKGGRDLVRTWMDGSTLIRNALQAYHRDVTSGAFPNGEESYR